MVEVVSFSHSVPTGTLPKGDEDYGRKGRNQRRASNRTHISGLDRLGRGLRIVLMCCLPVALSGCENTLYGTLATGDSTGAVLHLNPDAVQFGDVVLNAAAAQTVTLSSSGTEPVTITSAMLTGSGFTLSGPSFPVTLNAGQAVNLAVQFVPSTMGQATGQLTISSNSSTDSKAVISLSGTGTQPSAALSSLSCSDKSVMGSETDPCTVSLAGAAPAAGIVINLSSSGTGIAVPAAVAVPANATSTGFTATVAPVATPQAVTLTASAGSARKTFVVQLNAPAPTLTVAASNSPSTYGGTVTFTATISSGPTGTVTFYNGAASMGTATINGTTATLTTSSLSAGSHTITASWPGNSSYAGVTSSAITQVVNKATPTIIWNSPAAMTYGTALGSAQLDATATIAGTFSYSPAAGTVLTSGTHTITATFTPADTTDYATATDSVTVTVNAGLSLLSCSSGAITGAGTDSCTLTLTAAAPSRGLTLNLSSSDAAVTVPSTVTVPPGAASAEFTAAVASVTTAQTATITASLGSMFTSFSLRLNATILALSINPASVAFGNVAVNTPTTESITLSSTGTAPVTINGITLTGTGFTLSGPALPITLTPNQTTTVDISFDPTTAGAAGGQLTISSNASTNSTAVIGVTGTGVGVVTVTPASASTTVGTTQQFGATVTGTSNAAVTWTVSGSGCSGITCGTISSSGLYAAPAVVPSPATVTITATSVLDPRQSASSTVTIVPAAGATYYLAPGGNDSNNGLSPQTPWLSPNHPVKCGDVLIAQGNTYASPAVYSSANFWNEKWGTVTCPANNNVAWVACEPAFTCSITGTTQAAMFISASYWGVQGFQISGTGSSGGCMSIAPSYATGAEIHHIVIANNIVGPCSYDGIGSQDGYGTTPTTGTDYLEYLGNIVFETGGTSTNCSAGLSFFAPVASDTLPGTHYYMGGNFSFRNTSDCGDGEGAIFDTLDGVEAGWPTDASYSQQMVAENNIFVWNDGPGLQVDLNMNGTGPWAPVYFTHNTVAYNNQGPSSAGYCGEIVEGTTVTANSFDNLVDAPTQYCFGGSTVTHYGDLVAYSTANTISVYQEFAYNANGNGVGEVGSTGFTPGLNNTTGTNPAFTDPVQPGVPNCSGYTTTTACMATLIADYTPTNAAAKSYGYQQPSSTSVSDPYFPQWLCTTTNIPAGLVTMGCAP